MPEFGGQRGLAAQGDQFRRMAAGPHHLGRMRVERHHHRRQTEFPGLAHTGLRPAPGARGADRRTRRWSVRSDPSQEGSRQLRAIVPSLRLSFPVGSSPALQSARFRAPSMTGTPDQPAGSQTSRGLAIPADSSTSANSPVVAEQSVDAGDSGRRNGASEPHVGGQLGVDRPDGERQPDGVGRRDDRCSDAGGELGASPRPALHVPAHRRARRRRSPTSTSNGPTVVRRSAVRWPPTPRRRAQIPGQRADVGSGGALDRPHPGRCGRAAPRTRGCRTA